MTAVLPAATVPPRPPVGTDLSTTVLGSGNPVTVFAHGLGGDSAETQGLALRVPGTRVLFDFRGHGSSPPLDGGWEYDALADDLLEVADAVGARCAVGLSVGAGALLRVLERCPDRFERLAFVLPAALDGARPDGAVARIRALGAAIDAGDVEQVADLLLEELPPAVRERRGAQLLLRRRAQRLVLRPAPRPLHEDRPLRDRAVLADVRAPALVLAQEDDVLHDHALAAELAAALPQARLQVLPAGGVFWTAPRRVQDALAHHLREAPA